MKRHQKWFRRLRGALRAAVVIQLAVCAVLLAQPGFAGPKKILDKNVEWFSTGLKALSDRRGFWIDGSRFAITVLPEGEYEHQEWTETKTRVVLIDVDQRKIVALSKDADKEVILAFDPNTMDMYLGPPWRGSKTRRIHFEPNGVVSEVQRDVPRSDLAKLEWHYSVEKNRLIKSVGWRYEDGYFVEDDTMSQAESPAIRVRGRLRRIVWVRPDRPPLPLPLRFDDIDIVEYVPFLNKYLLNTYDTASRRPGHPPFRLLDKDGKIDEIPYPAFVHDYGLDEPIYKGPGAVNVNFGEFVLTRAGILVDKTREHGSAIYLFENDQLYRITGGRHLLGIPLGPTLSAEGAGSFQVSPDGCKVAYRHLNVNVLEAVGPPQFLSFFNVCRAKQ
ncbi:MAG TPA: hypothetical protein VFP68_18520 [Burkholderiaceae bacterium]|nr:hypothetical protein [Burkholderiaceae bacterium]